ncbi:MAG TPA: MotA/TolQ/ExbB proton channel family protein [Gammaproteobacteria bacterium]|nr:MotA/TolQ/ExbB proton channel family protein [Gammaproteobacteria bacterium]
METYHTIVRFLQEGGVFIYPIVLILALGLAIAIERFMYLSRTRSANVKVWNQLLPLIEAGKFREARLAAEESGAAVAKILAYGLSRLSSAKRRDDIETAMEEGLMEMVPRLEKRTHYLATFANIATLLGLLGTIIGLIQAFTAVSAADPAQKAELLSSSISVAMNTTAFGLMVAIPLLLIYAFLSSKTTELVDSLEMASVKFLNIIGEHAATSGSKPA